MARNIKSRSGRARLPVDPDSVYWTKHATGQYVGFRKTAAGTGTWWARYRDPATRKQHYRQLGDLAAHQPARQYDAAVKAALAWFRQVDAGAAPERHTVGDACRRHVSAIRASEGDEKADETEGRFRRFVYSDKLAQIDLGRLRKAHLEDWRQRIATAPARVWRRKSNGRIGARNRPGKAQEETRQRSAATVNRDMVPLRAALNRALDDGLVASDLAWRVALRATENADRRRDIYLDRAERAQLLAKAGADIKPFVMALTLVPLRVGALASLTASDFDARRSTLRVGRDKAGADRWIRLPEPTRAFFAERVKGKLPAAPIFTDGYGRAWSRDTWKHPIKAAIVSAGLPLATSAYTLRHAVITDLVSGGLPLLAVAQISGTSAAMIERHYGHLQQDQAAAALATLVVGMEGAA